MSYESKGGDEYYDKVTLTLDRKCAEDLYYSLLLALGGHDYKDSGGKNGKNGGKGYEPPPQRYPPPSY